MIKSSRIYDPILNNFTPLNSDRGRIILKSNEMCDKCDTDKIYNINTNRCVSKKGKYNQILAKEIEYCEKYVKAMKESRATDKKIIKNILNIKIPRHFLKGKKKSIMVKDFMDNINNPNQYDSKLALNLNIKDEKYAYIISVIPGLLYGLYEIMVKHPEVSKYLLNAIKTISSKSGKGIASFFINVFTKYFNSPFLMRMVSGLSFKKFMAFISSVAVVVSNLPAKMFNKKTVENIAERTLIGNDIPYYLADARDNYDEEDQYKEHELSEMDKITLSRFKNVYDEDEANKINLSSLGINLANVRNKGTKLIFDEDHETQEPYVQIHTPYQKPKSVYIFQETKRKQHLKDFKRQTEKLLKTLDNKKNSIIDMKNNQKKYTITKEIKKTNKDLKEMLNDLEKGSEEYNDIKSRLNFNLSQLKETEQEIKDFKPFESPAESKKMQDILGHTVNWTTSLKKLKKDFDDSILNENNVNYYHGEIMHTLDNASNFIKSTNQKNIKDALSSTFTGGPQQKSSSNIFLTPSEVSRNTNVSSINNNASFINNRVLSYGNNQGQSGSDVKQKRPVIEDITEIIQAAKGERDWYKVDTSTNKTGGSSNTQRILGVLDQSDKEREKKRLQDEADKQRLTEEADKLFGEMFG